MIAISLGCASYCCKNKYRSFVNERPWAEHLQVRQGGGALSNVSAERAPIMAIYGQFTATQCPRSQYNNGTTAPPAASKLRPDGTTTLRTAPSHPSMSVAARGAPCIYRYIRPYAKLPCNK